MNSLWCFEHYHTFDYLPCSNNWIFRLVRQFYIGIEPISEFMFFELYRHSHVTGPLFRERPFADYLLGVFDSLVDHIEFEWLFGPSCLNKAQCNEHESSSHGGHIQFCNV